MAGPGGLEDSPSAGCSQEVPWDLGRHGYVCKSNVGKRYEEKIRMCNEQRLRVNGL